MTWLIRHWSHGSSCTDHVFIRQWSVTDRSWSWDCAHTDHVALSFNCFLGDSNSYWRTKNMHGAASWKNKKKSLTLEWKEAIPGSVGGFSRVDICPAGVTAGLRVLSLNSVWFPSHFSHLPTEQTRVDQFGVLVPCFKFMMRANVILEHLRGEFS